MVPYWYVLIIGPISPQSLCGNRTGYILTISDYFTRFGWAKALPSKEAEGVVSALKEVLIVLKYKYIKYNLFVIVFLQHH